MTISSSQFSGYGFQVNSFAAMTKADLAYSRIRQQILSGELAPDADLDQEGLAADLGLSTTPVREALRRLESEGLVLIRAHRVATVSPLSYDAMVNVYELRLLLDPAAVAAAANQITADDGERLRTMATDHPRNPDPVAHLNWNRHLHRSIYAACGNPILINILDSLWDMSDRYRMIMVKDRAQSRSARQDHLAIVSAVADKHADRAARLMYEHVAESRARLRSVFE
ncbi:GntR family transcriptional regulator [Rugosimonospora acidiphila]|uniref:GntR family transcriptional regulator n=1 Tax=Rugosimonospora acidiphila TaxID=556531 RepID=A0ABP9SRK0_9ACTN